MGGKLLRRLSTWDELALSIVGMVVEVGRRSGRVV